jgi:rRNA small subunit pseudouridine methyltransferase Nep1
VLTIILAESELEIVPEKIISHPSVINYSKHYNKKPGNIILEASFHHSAIRNLPDAERRGRPDIVHFFLLTALESILNKEGKLKVIVHTRNNEVIYIDPKTRLMKNYIRFIGLIEQLFKKKVITYEKKILLEFCENKTLENLIKEEKHDFVISFSPDGKKVKLLNYLKNLKKKDHKNILCIIGGFPHGNFHNDISKFSDDIISIYDNTLTAWAVTNELIVIYENIF